jgi:hypothetical protein
VAVADTGIAHGLAAGESADDARPSLSLLHVSTLPDLGPHPCSCALPTGGVQASARPGSSLSRRRSQIRMGMDACVLSLPGTPSQLCCGVHCIWFLDAAIPQSLDDQTRNKGWRRRTRAEERGLCRRSVQSALPAKRFLPRSSAVGWAARPGNAGSSANGRPSPDTLSWQATRRALSGLGGPSPLFGREVR